MILVQIYCITFVPCITIWWIILRKLIHQRTQLHWFSQCPKRITPGDKGKSVSDYLSLDREPNSATEGTHSITSNFRNLITSSYFVFTSSLLMCVLYNCSLFQILMQCQMILWIKLELRHGFLPKKDTLKKEENLKIEFDNLMSCKYYLFWDVITISIVLICFWCLAKTPFLLFCGLSFEVFLPFCWCSRTFSGCFSSDGRTLSS